jgi:hypothetical protein
MVTTATTTTMKVKVISRTGLVHAGKTHAEGAEINLEGGSLAAALRFKQVAKIAATKETPEGKAKK